VSTHRSKELAIMHRLENKVAIVTGGASGIGAGTALRLAAEGAAVVIGDVNSAGAEAIADRIIAEGGRAIGLDCDISNELSVRILIKSAVEVFGGIDCLFANAADMSLIPADHDALSISLDVFDATVRIDLRGQLLCTRAVLPELLKRGRGSIIYTSSDASCIGEPVRVSYAVAKAGVEALMRHVSTRWGPNHITANVVAPGYVLTNNVKALLSAEQINRMELETPIARLGKPEDIAAMVAMLVSRDGEWITGQVLHVNGGAIKSK
jgi:NAD(P)-dependent dehydrogenase (short-subunit alcohol dehydrogenase family)